MANIDELTWSDHAKLEVIDNVGTSREVERVGVTQKRLNRLGCRCRARVGEVVHDAFIAFLTASTILE